MITPFIIHDKGAPYTLISEKDRLTEAQAPLESTQGWGTGTSRYFRLEPVG